MTTTRRRRPAPKSTGTPRRPGRRTESGPPPEAADGYSPDGWEANHAVLSHLSEHRVAWKA
ncbi:hypothetical protein ACFWBR_12055 [Streptomyces sp. NPDC060006]|uniref:hypothetical protein n=1 Tax=Streptomyces sp. NPDC060006 TaxID=3347035 RepID=UPI00368AB910